MRLAVVVIPKSHKDEVCGWRDGADGNKELLVRVKSAPEHGKATKAVSEVLAKYYDIPKSSIICVRGSASRHKIFELPDV